MFESILIANRGEIACRIARTCRRLGIRAIAVFSDADACARHVREADVAVRIGPAPARASYLDAQAIVRAAVEHGAQAVHPGYGFLSEKHELIDACATADLTFIGPHRDAIARMGSKIESKRIARAAGVACVPGYDGNDQRDERLRDEAACIGFPLLIKASAGGGGKGMKRVDRAGDFAAQLAAARAEAQATFSDDRVLLERCIERPRHLEVQLVGDRYGGLVHLFERECSIQRRYQKVIEEAPAAHLSDAVRTQLYDGALALGRAIGYDSAGTVEFVLDAERGDLPYFLEMNTRLQVEHPVTELTTGLDLVELQIRSALGERLPFDQAAIRRRGWAIEARINAEVPAAGFRASCGPVRAYAEPRGEGLRVDSGIDATSEVTPHYDSMLTKVIAFGATRAVARERLRQGVRGLHIAGVQTNQPLLDDVLGLPAFDEVLTTRFLAEAFPGGWQAAPARDDEHRCAAAAAWFFAQAAACSDDRPLRALTGFRVTTPAGRVARYTLRVGEPGTLARVEVECREPRRVECRLGDALHRFESGEGIEGLTTLWAGTRRYRVGAHDGGIGLGCEGDWRHWTILPELRHSVRGAAPASRGDAVCAELPGVVTQLLVEPGQAVVAGDPVAVIEAMKLFHTLVAPCAGTVRALAVRTGDTVQRGAVLVALIPAES